MRGLIVACTLLVGGASASKVVAVGDDVGSALQQLGTVVKSVFGVVNTVEEIIAGKSSDPNDFGPDVIKTVEDGIQFCGDALVLVRDYKPDSVVAKMNCPQLSVGENDKSDDKTEKALEALPMVMLTNKLMLDEISSIFSNEAAMKKSLRGPSKPVEAQHISALVGDALFLLSDGLAIYVDKHPEFMSSITKMGAQDKFGLIAASQATLRPASEELKQYRAGASLLKKGALKMKPTDALRIVSGVSQSLGQLAGFVSLVAKTVADAEAPALPTVYA